MALYPDAVIIFRTFGYGVGVDGLMLEYGLGLPGYRPHGGVILQSVVEFGRPTGGAHVASLGHRVTGHLGQCGASSEVALVRVLTPSVFVVVVGMLQGLQHEHDGLVHHGHARFRIAAEELNSVYGL